MLVVSRKHDESLVIDVQGTPVYVHVLRTAKGFASIGIDAPKHWNIRRSELPMYLQGSA